MFADEVKEPKPEPVEAEKAEAIAGVAIAACSVGLVVLVIFDIASIKASASLFMHNIRIISGT